MLTLYGSTGSGSAAIEAGLRLAGLDFRPVDAASWQPGPGLDELLTHNPLGQIPTLVLDDGSVLTESAAILIELGLRHPASGLLPQDPAARAQAIRGLVYIAANCYAAISVIDFPERWSEPCDEAAREHIRQGSRLRLHRHWEIFADQFGAALAAAPRPDGLALLAAVVSRWSGSRAHLQQQRPALHAQLLRVEQDETVAAVFARHWPAT